MESSHKYQSLETAAASNESISVDVVECCTVFLHEIIHNIDSAPDTAPMELQTPTQQQKPDENFDNLISQPEQSASVTISDPSITAGTYKCAENHTSDITAKSLPELQNDQRISSIQDGNYCKGVCDAEDSSAMKARKSLQQESSTMSIKTGRSGVSQVNSVVLLESMDAGNELQQSELHQRQQTSDKCLKSALATQLNENGDDGFFKEVSIDVVETEVSLDVEEKKASIVVVEIEAAIDEEEKEAPIDAVEKEVPIWVRKLNALTNIPLDSTEVKAIQKWATKRTGNVAFAPFENEIASDYFNRSFKLMTRQDIPEIIGKA